MHRKDYILIAKVLRKVVKGVPKAILVNDFCTALKQENSLFNETKFRDYIEKGG